MGDDFNYYLLLIPLLVVIIPIGIRIFQEIIQRVKASNKYSAKSSLDADYINDQYSQNKELSIISKLLVVVGLAKIKKEGDNNSRSS